MIHHGNVACTRATFRNPADADLEWIFAAMRGYGVRTVGVPPRFHLDGGAPAAIMMVASLTSRYRVVALAAAESAEAVLLLSTARTAYEYSVVGVNPAAVNVVPVVVPTSPSGPPPAD
jgi:hypothetical protein